MADARTVPMEEGEARSRRIPRPLAALAVASTLPLALAIASQVDAVALATGWRALLADPAGWLLAVGAFAAAFCLRAIAWRRVLPALPLSQGLAALHVSLGGNHVLPLRMGEPLRVVSVVRRAGVGWREAAASTLTLRAADTVAVAGLGLAVGMGRIGAGAAGAWLVAAGALAVAAAGGWWLARLRSSGRVRLPGAVALSMTAGAWVLESIVVWQAARWTGVGLDPGEALLVTAAAVVAQVVAVAPGGIGTYEAGGTAAMTVLGHAPQAALAAVVLAHLVKTAYSLVAGGVAVFVPSPGLLGRLRLRRPAVSPPPAAPSPQGRPVVLFLPAHDEEDAVGDVVRRVPASVDGHPVRCLVIDDGSTDSTAEVARVAGAEVIRLDSNRGLGAAVRCGLAEALTRDPVAIAFCDADGEYAPQELERLVAPILAGEADYVVGSRFAGEIGRMLPHRRVGNRLLTLALSWIARRRISDGQSGYRAFSPAAAASAELIHDFNYAQVLTLDLLAKGFRYTEVPISYTFRTTGRSFVRPARYLRKVIPAVWRELNTA